MTSPPRGKFSPVSMNGPQRDAIDSRSLVGINPAVLWAAALLCCALASPSPVRAADGELELTAVLELGAQFVPDRWVPVRVELTNRTSREIDGYVSMPVSDRRAPFVVRQPCRVPANSRVRLSLLGTFAPPDGADDPRTSGAPLARIDWYSSAGERLAVTDLLGMAQRETPGVDGGAFRSTFVLVISDQSAADDAPPQPIASGPLASLDSVWINVTNAPRQRAGYDGFRFVVLSGVHPDALDVAQQAAMLDHLLVGGVIVCPAPDPDWNASWLEPYLPVECIAQRTTASIEGVKLRTSAVVTQALAGRGQIVARDPHYVHAAFQPVGLGRVVFTSFPLESLDPADEAAEPLWTRLLGPGAVDASWESSQLAADHTDHLDAMVGVATAPWAVAAAVVAAYLGIAVGAQMTFTGARRPTGFVLIVIVALTGAATLAGISIAGQRDDALSGARLATLDLSSAGGGVYQEELAFVGADEPSLHLAAHDANTTLHPIAADTSRPPVVQTDPFAAPEAGARASVVEHVWRAKRPVATNVRLHARATFGPEGLALSFDNSVGGFVRTPVLVWRATGAVFPLDDIGTGPSSGARPGERNSHGDFGHAAVVTSELAKLRTVILQSASTPSSAFIAETSDPIPLLAGWLDDAAIPATLSITPQPAMRSAVLVRAPLELRPSDVGTRVRINGGFVRIAPSATTMGMPYDERRRQWISTGTTGRWLVGFLPPKQVGRLRPWRVALACDPSAPQHIITVRGEQVAGATPAVNRAGRVIAEWPQPIGRHQVAFEPSPQDLDVNGHVWLLLSVQTADDDDDTAPPQWSLRTISLSYDEAEVVENPMSLKQ